MDTTISLNPAEFGENPETSKKEKKGMSGGAAAGLAAGVTAAGAGIGIGVAALVDQMDAAELEEIDDVIDEEEVVETHHTPEPEPIGHADVDVNEVTLEPFDEDQQVDPEVEVGPEMAINDPYMPMSGDDPIMIDEIDIDEPLIAMEDDYNLVDDICGDLPEEPDYFAMAEDDAELPQSDFDIDDDSMLLDNFQDDLMA